MKQDIFQSEKKDFTYPSVGFTTSSKTLVRFLIKVTLFAKFSSFSTRITPMVPVPKSA